MSDAARAAARVWAAVVKRDDAIRAERAEGVSLRVLAERTGLSHQTIARICARETTGRPGERA